LREAWPETRVIVRVEEVPVEGRVITVDALHTTRDTARSIVDTHGVD